MHVVVFLCIRHVTLSSIYQTIYLPITIFFLNIPTDLLHSYQYLQTFKVINESLLSIFYFFSLKTSLSRSSFSYLSGVGTSLPLCLPHS